MQKKEEGNDFRIFFSLFMYWFHWQLFWSIAHIETKIYQSISIMSQIRIKWHFHNHRHGHVCGRNRPHTSSLFASAAHTGTIGTEDPIQSTPNYVHVWLYVWVCASLCARVIKLSIISLYVLCVCLYGKLPFDLIREEI